MVAREDLHRLVDELPESELEPAHRYLDFLRREGDDSFDRLLKSAPVDDEPRTPDEDAGAAEARQQYLRGEVVPAEEIRRLLGS